jgi:hypothetical protein
MLKSKSRPAARRILVNGAALLLALAATNEASDASEGFIDGDGI